MDKLINKEILNKLINHVNSNDSLKCFRNQTGRRVLRFVSRTSTLQGLTSNIESESLGMKKRINLKIQFLYNKNLAILPTQNEIETLIATVRLFYLGTLCENRLKTS